MSDRINFQFVTAFIFSNRNVPILTIFMSYCIFINDHNVKSKFNVIFNRIYVVIYIIRIPSKSINRLRYIKEMQTKVAAAMGDMV